ncbi:hypothetical protein ACFHYO_13940 [Paracoccus panacisoli]|uniref:Uncharacterized protein n=2 Tax=Paracoccus TaxID=265 RepID=A0A099G9V1_9RHOB|nr:hypothetical protein [Paracoccus sanguinis]KGJ12899.1 hypothetical protein IX54_14515 [Paracoccus sanguinis]KGJ19387.1 hypothetical protein IX56_16290 [Paracoccus sanguinis]
MTVWDVLIWGGAGLAALGLAGIVWCIVAVLGARRRALDDAAMRAVMRRVVAVNMAALAASMLGLMAVVLGIMLGR